MKNKLQIRGARQHNLKDVAVDIDKNKLRFDNSVEKLLFHGHTFSIDPITNPIIIV